MTDRRGPRSIAPGDPAPRRRRAREQRDSDANRMVTLYVTDRRSIRQIAAEIGVSYGTARNTLVAANVQLRGRGGANRPPRVDTTRTP